jgi:DNA-binding phage protein
MSEGEGGVAARTRETDGMKKEAVPKTVSKRNNPFFMTLLRRVSDTLLMI